MSVKGRLANLVTAKPEINYTEKDDADPNIGTDTRAAVDNLDFETAERITMNSRLSNHNYLRDTSAKLMMDLDEEDNQVHEEKLRLENTLKERAEEDAQTIKHEYQSKFARLVTKHRREAEELKEKWIQHHNHAESVAMKKIEDLKHTSKVLASCECYEAAKDLRDRTVLNENQIIYNETNPVDQQFHSQFDTMISRHREMYDALFVEMNNKIHLARQDADVQFVKENVELTYRTALSPVEMMKKISQSEDMSIAEKTSMIRTMTPSKLSPLSSRASSRMRQSQQQEMSEEPLE
ncbi:hypothetical protein TRFO_34284 [Tritrichomonas foetus]|uniref:Uncharacterized protein n=1 Tax=Tritrichomonas foetus TaxID=1144522 RepID=A0A1J4JJH1_9EUKA|nr:hypothetical protein TRFO_34284 [Tritrichomonas foetus]|eukprot:OHS99310.1 hypothetical protein TRFO_34284 [Tritrichomonas foetus]